MAHSNIDHTDLSCSDLRGATLADRHEDESTHLFAGASRLRQRRGRATGSTALLVSLAVSTLACSGENSEQNAGGAGGGATDGSGGEGMAPPPKGGESSGGAPSGGAGGGTDSGGTGTGAAVGVGGTDDPGTGGDEAGSGGDSGSGSGGGGDGRMLFPAAAAHIWGELNLPVEDAAFTPMETSCEPPCAAALIDNGDLAWPESLSAALYIDFEGPSATLYQDMSGANEDLFAMGFTYEANQYGYSAYFSGPMTDVFSKNVEYTTNLDHEWEYSMWQDEVMTFQITSESEQEMALVSFSFGDEIVRVHEVKIPTCATSSQSGACTNEADCPLVDTGAAGHSAECADCFAGISTCTEQYCQEDCAVDQAGNGCLRCQTDAGCHTEFMACSGLDFLPWNSLEFAEW